MLRTRGGYAGWTDDQLLRIPYLRFEQEVRLAADAAVRAGRTEQRLAAFIGWQVRSAVSMGGRPPTFRAYLNQLGIPPEDAPTKAQLDAERAERDARMARVRDAFARGGAVKVASG